MVGWRGRTGINVVSTLALASLAVVVTSVQVPPAILFTDITQQAGIKFLHQNGAAGAMWYPELFGGGVAVLDIDSDGWPDLLFVDGKNWQPGQRPRHGLYRNNHDGTFKDVLIGSGLERVEIYGLGATVADYDNDGRDDLFLTTVDGGRLFHNEGGRFLDVTASAGIRNGDFCVSAAWFDYDRDGRVDLLIGNYVRWSPATDVHCLQDGVRGYCGPDAFRPVAPRLFRNFGAGRFEDATARTGLNNPTDKAMGVAILDYNMDGWPDVFIGNDRVPAKLYRNDGHGRFVEDGLQLGVALSENGAARANMGVDAADYDRSGHPDLVVGNFFNEMLGLYRNEDRERFVDVAPRSAVGRASLLNVTWGVFFLDYDLDGFLDIFAANGGTDAMEGMDRRGRLSQRPLLLRNSGGGTFADVTATAGPGFARPVMGRGAAYLDADGDGDLDIAVATLGAPAYLFRNDGGNRNNWLRVRVVSSQSNRSGLGALVGVRNSSGTQLQTVHSGSSYASQSELTLTFGLGRDARASAVDIAWPSGKNQSFSDVAANQILTIDEARGIVPTARTLDTGPVRRAP